MSTTIQEDRIKEIERHQAQAKTSYDKARAEGHDGASEHYKNRLSELAADLIRAKTA